MAIPITTLVALTLLVAGGVGTTAFLLHGPEEPCDAGAEVEGGARASSGASAGCGATLPCPSGAVAPFDTAPNGTWGRARFAIENQGNPLLATLCVVDSAGVKRHETEQRLPADEMTYEDVPLPAGIYHASVQVTHLRSSDGSATVQTRIDLLNGCPQGLVVLPVTTRADTESGLTVHGWRDRCEDLPEPVDETGAKPMGLRTNLPPGGPALLERTAWGLVAFSASGAALSGLAFLARSEPVRWGLLGLFSRVRRPRALDHELRAQVHALVEAEPGLRPEAIRRRLGLAGGQAAHHLRILMQTGLVTRLRLGGVHHYFSAGRHGNTEMLRCALLQRGATREVYDTLSHMGASDVSTLARACGVSVGYASRLAAQMAEAGLVERTRAGRRVIVRATGVARAR